MLALVCALPSNLNNDNLKAIGDLMVTAAPGFHPSYTTEVLRKITTALVSCTDLTRPELPPFLLWCVKTFIATCPNEKSDINFFPAVIYEWEAVASMGGGRAFAGFDKYSHVLYSTGGEQPDVLSVSN